MTTDNKNNAHDQDSGQGEQPKTEQLNHSEPAVEPPANAETEAKHVQADDMPYISDTNAAMLMRTPRGGRLLIYLVLITFITAIAWANFAQVDEITRGSGIVIPSSRLQVVQNLEGGILVDSFVQEGEQVSAGQPLMQLDDTQFSSSFRESSIEYFTDVAKVARLQAELTNKPIDFPEVLDDYPEYIEQEQKIYRRRARQLEAEINVLKSQSEQARHELVSAREQLTYLKSSFELGNEELQLTIPLAKQGVVSKVELLQLRQRVNDLKSDMRKTELSLPKLESVYNESRAKQQEILEKYRADIVQELKETEVNIEQLTESQTALEDQVDRTVIRSPMDGVVKTIHVTTIGGVVQPGMSLLEIVPLEDNLLIETKIQPKDIGFLRKDMKATVKLTAYDFAIYGGLKGYVEHISADTITDEEGKSFYIVHIRTDRNYVGTEEKPLVIIPGMRTDVDIITGAKSIMDYLLKPILKAKQNALTER